MWNKTREEAREYWRTCKWTRGYRHMVELDDEFPSVGMFEPTCISAEVGPGWVPLLRPVLAVLAKHGCTVGQVKQKFCVLTVYWDPPSNPEGGLGTLSHDARREIETVIAACVDISMHSCEGCGRHVPEGGGESMTGRRLCDPCVKAPRD